MKQYLYYLLLFGGRFLLFPVYFLSGLVPRRSDLWVFGSWGGHRFADNAAAFFLYCREQIQDDISRVWISRDRSIIRRLCEEGFEAYWIWSPGGMLACLRASVHVFDCFPKDTNFWLSRGAKRINLWSGVPLKVFERDIDVPSNRYYRLFHGRLVERVGLAMMMPWHVIKPDLIIATSDEMKEITERAFALPPHRVRVTGFPRTDALVNPEQAAKSMQVKVPQSLTDAAASDQKVFLYLPTFRDDNKAYMNIDWAKLDDHMKKIGGKFFFKTHPMDKLENSVDLKNVEQLPQSMDIYAALPHTDALISDYSSIIFDYMLLPKAIVYYTPDLEEFVSGSRSLNFHPTELAVGPMCSDFNELLSALTEIAQDSTDRFEERRRAVMPRVHKFVDDRACNRVMTAIRQFLPEGSEDAPVAKAVDKGTGA